LNDLWKIHWLEASGDYRRWHGYTLGYQMVAAWLRINGKCTTEKWFSVTADEVIAAGLADGLLTK